jgi:hypothetical protein
MGDRIVDHVSGSIWGARPLTKAELKAKRLAYRKTRPGWCSKHQCIHKESMTLPYPSCVFPNQEKQA